MEIIIWNVILWLSDQSPVNKQMKWIFLPCTMIYAVAWMVSTLLEAKQVYCPPSAWTTFWIYNPPEGVMLIRASLGRGVRSPFVHETLGCGWPAALHSRVTLSPTSTSVFWGWITKLGLAERAEGHWNLALEAQRVPDDFFSNMALLRHIYFQQHTHACSLCLLFLGHLVKPHKFSMHCWWCSLWSQHSVKLHRLLKTHISFLSSCRAHKMKCRTGFSLQASSLACVLFRKYRQLCKAPPALNSWLWEVWVETICSILEKVSRNFKKLNHQTKSLSHNHSQPH